MSHCCDKPSVFDDPCQAIEDGILTPGNYQSYGITPGQYLLLLAQCGGSISISVNTDDLESLATEGNVLLGQIDANLDAIEALITDGNIDLAAIEVLITSSNVLLTAIDANLDAIGVLVAATNALLTEIRDDARDDDLFGTHTVATGTHAAAPAAGPYSSWVVVKTNATGTVTVDGITLNIAGDSTSEEAQPQFKVPAPTITLDGGNLGEYEWRTKS